jgi:hypothetical protein
MFKRERAERIRDVIVRKKKRRRGRGFRYRHLG